jgi:hypothetical protein
MGKSLDGAGAKYDGNVRWFGWWWNRFRCAGHETEYEKDSEVKG